MSLSLKPHHILCSIGFTGRGYDGPFVANMANIVNGQLQGPHGRDLRILLTWRADAICAPCPRRVGLDCRDQRKITRLDDDHAKALGVGQGEVLSWGDCLDRVRANIVPGDLDTICATCEWLPLGVCKEKLAALLAQDATPQVAAAEVTVAEAAATEAAARIR